MGVIAGVFFHAFGEGTPRPIGLLRAFIKLGAEEFFDEGAEAELQFAEQPRGQHGVKNPGDQEVMVLAEQAQIVIRRMKN